MNSKFISLSEYRPIPLRRLTDLCANPELVTLEEAILIRDNEIAHKEVIRIGLSPTAILNRYKVELDRYDEEQLFEE